MPGTGSGPARVARDVVAQRRYDVVVVGAGGAGLLAACIAADSGARVAVMERENVTGGTTAISGGHMWIPNHRHLREVGVSDSLTIARDYLQRVTGGSVPAAQVETFLREGPTLVTYLEDELGIRLFPVRRPDYHPTWAGARDCRTVEPMPLGGSLPAGPGSQIRRSATRPPLTSEELRAGAAPDLIAERQAGEVMTQGAALIGGLLRGCIARGVDIITGCRVLELALDKSGVLCGVRGATGGRDESIDAGQVVLACGGFESSSHLRRDLLPPVPMWPVSPPGHTGDGLLMALRAGAAMRMPGEAWWTAAIRIPKHNDAGEELTVNVVRELARPRAILVNRSGRRFVNEASPYNDLGKAFLEFDPGSHTFPNSAAWLIFDGTYQRRYGIGPIPAGGAIPDWILVDANIAGLAERVGIDGEALAATVAGFNVGARLGSDPEFARGENAHDRYNGDEHHTPNPCLGPIETPPFCALPVGLGLNGTKGGLVTDSLGRVLTAEGTPIAGLYACGDVAAATMGLGYAGSGASLGPGLTMAMMAGAAAANAASEAWS